jgi:PAS domain S-box-containing protein
LHETINRISRNGVHTSPRNDLLQGRDLPWDELETPNAEIHQTMNDTEKDLQKYKAMFDLAPVGSVILGRDGLIRAANSAAAEILGSGCSELVGLRMAQFIPEAARLIFSDFLEKTLNVRQKAACEMEFMMGGNRSLLRFEGISDVSSNDCYIMIIDSSGFRSLNEADTALLVDNESDPRLREFSDLQNENRKLSKEISIYCENEKKRADSHTRKQILSDRLMKVWEDERTAFAREIHDELGQMLAALQLNVSMIAMEYRDHERLVAKTAEMEKMLVTSINTVQRISSEMRPVMLDMLGLADAMEWQAKEFGKMSGIACHISMRLSKKKLDRDLSSVVFRLFKHALSNVMYHSGATRVQVDIVERKSCLTLSVRDDGRRIFQKEKKDIQSLGITRMQEQIDVLGGKLRVCDSPRYGAAVFARIPLAGKENWHAYENTCSR